MAKNVIRILGILLGCMFCCTLASGQDKEIAEIASRLSSKIQSGGIRSIAVLGFSDAPLTDDFSNYVVKRLNLLLAGQVRDLRVINRTQVESAMRDAGIRTMGDIPPATLEGLGKRLGVTAVVTGSYTVSKDHVSLDAAVIDVASGNLISGHSVRIGNTPDMLALLGKTEIPEVVLPVGMVIAIRLADPILGDKAKPGDWFRAALDSAITVKGVTVALRGAEVRGRVDSVVGKAKLALSLVSVAGKDGQLIMIRTQSLGEAAATGSSGGATRVGSAVGGAVGSTMGGMSGTAIGAGSSVPRSATSGSKGRVVLAAETRLEFRLADAVSVAAGK
jgi:TolB-like protein